MNSNKKYKKENSVQINKNKLYVLTHILMHRYMPLLVSEKTKSTQYESIHNGMCRLISCLCRHIRVLCRLMHLLSFCFGSG